MKLDLRNKQIEIKKSLGIWFAVMRVGNHKLLYSDQIHKCQIFYNEYNIFKKKSHRIWCDTIDNVPDRWHEEFIELKKMYEKHMATIGF